MNSASTEDVLKTDVLLLFGKSTKKADIVSQLLYSTPVQEVVQDTIEVEAVPSLDDWLVGGKVHE